jgi:hypothetical protein
MRSNDTDDLAEGFEPAPLAIGPDGGVAMTARAREIPPPPRLCAAGPCRHYHTFTIQLDAERPMAGHVAQGAKHGALVGDGGPAPFHVRRHHYCYPDVGIETELGDLPVLECSRWTPQLRVDQMDDLERREQFLHSDAGRKYTYELEDWKAARAAAEADVELDTPRIQSVVVTVGGHDQEIVVDGAPMTMREVRQLALNLAYGQAALPAPTESYRLLDTQGNEVSNLDATLDLLGIVDGERFVLTLPAGAGG